MSIRVVALYMIVAGLSLYAWKDWFKSLCGLILLTALLGHPDFPKTGAGVQGLNPWNILFVNVFLAWLVSRKCQGLSWDMPTHISLLLVLWLGVILIGWLRMVFDRGRLPDITMLSLVSEQLINTVKWPLLGLLVFDGCRTRGQAKMVIVCVFLYFTLFAVQMCKSVPPRAVLAPGNIRARMNLMDDMGVSPNGAAKMMSGVPWAILAVTPLFRKWKYRVASLSLCAMYVYVEALTGGRSGYVACGTTLLLLCLLRWRQCLPLLPLALLILPAVLPGATSRMLVGFGQTNVSGEEFIDASDVTSGRSEIWPVVIAKILESPGVGFGREAMQRTGVKQFLEDKYGVSEGVGVSHPHNAYLEVLLESGLIGFVVIIGLHLCLWLYSVRLFVDRGDPVYTAVGGLVLALLTGDLVAYIGGQSFYAEQIDVGLWCAIGVMLRAYVVKTGLGHVDAYGAGAPYLVDGRYDYSCVNASARG